MIIHSIDPVFDDKSKVLILGSFPSVKSREEGFFYAHRQNRFWKVVATAFESDVPESIDEKRRFLLQNRIALWDVIASCEIEGSSDASIKNVKANDIKRILDNAQIERIFVNGRTAEKYYNMYIKDTVGRDAVCLPSTSPANAAWDIKRLVKAWSIIKK